MGCVTRVYSSLAVIDVTDGLFVLWEKLPTLTSEALRALTGAELHRDGPVADLLAPSL